MDLNAFSKSVDLLEQREIEKVRLLAYFHQKTTGKAEFQRVDVSEWFESLNLPSPNLSRIERNISSSRAFVRGKTKGFFKLHASEFDSLQQQHPGVHIHGEEVVSGDVILPRPIYEESRGFIESLSKQINATYDFNIFDGCAVLMRRLLEILLILSYEHLKIDAVIRGKDGNYLMLEKIVSDAKTNPTLKLSRDAKSVLDEFRTLGNFSAHKIYYNSRRADIQRIQVHYRATIEELMYKSGIRS